MPPAAQALALTTPIDEAPGVTPARARALRDLGVRNVGLLVAHLPMRFERVEGEVPIAQLVAGALVTARGVVAATRPVMRGKRRFEVVLMDESGRLDLVWFNMLYLRHSIQPGVHLRVQGKAVRRAGGGLQLANPKHWVLGAPGPVGSTEPAPSEERLRPVYPASSGVTSMQIEALVGRVLPAALPLIDDHLPADLRAARELPELRAAYRMIHQPASEAEWAHARRRLAYDELLLLQLGVALRRDQRRRLHESPPLPWTPAIDRRIRTRLPFTLTPDQDAVIREVVADLTTARPANRLIQGDVGSGKTAVAVYAMLMAAAGGAQAALMAPTELLAEQHHASITRLLEGARVRVELLTGSLDPAERARVGRGLGDGEIKLVVGTHALLTEAVAFSNLALAVIDEQHRFGVHQRAGLRTKGAATRPGKRADAPGHVPHILVMTATPIPRTLAMTVMGDLDVSTIRHLPPGRKGVGTRLVPPERLGEVWSFVRARVERGEQAYVVAPTIDGVGDADLFPGGAGGAPGPAPAGVLDVARALREGALKGLGLEVVHGRLAPAQRAGVMARFREGHTRVLVATSVIEVGVDVPSATIMVVLDADRFGLATLHQLRGRVGRGGRMSACIVVPTAGLNQPSPRLEALLHTVDGFALAEMDLQLRGFGSMLGTEQSGVPPFRVADLERDMDLLQLARRDAQAWIARSPDLARPDEVLARRRLLKTHGAWLGLGDVG